MLFRSDVFHDKVLKDTLLRGNVFGISRLFQLDNVVEFSFKARDQVKLYSIAHADLTQYLDNNPGVHIRLYEHPY